MRFYWMSNAPHVGTGYGQQTDIWTQLMRRDGHEVVIRGFYGYHGSPFKDAIGRTILPSSYHGYGDDVAVMDWREHKPDAGVILADAWVYSKQTVTGAPFAWYAPVDHTPIPPATVQRLQYARWVWAMSRHGEREMRQAGIDPFYVPHGINPAIFKPIDRAKARENFGINEKQFFAVTVAANKGFPDRKGLRALVKAWAALTKVIPDALLYIHANIMDNHHGLDLVDLAKFYGMGPNNVRFADSYKFMNGQYLPHHLNEFYNAADVFVLPSAGEGFGIPAIEAQAAGCPVILSDFTAQTELCGSGWLCEIDPLDDVEYTPQNSEQCRVKPSVILENLLKAYDARSSKSLREKARHFGLTYDAEKIYADWLLPALKIQAGIVDVSPPPSPLPAAQGGGEKIVIAESPIVPEDTLVMGVKL